MYGNYPSGSPEFIPKEDGANGSDVFDVSDAAPILIAHAIELGYSSPSQITTGAYYASQIVEATEGRLASLGQHLDVTLTWNTVDLHPTSAYRDVLHAFIGDGPADGALPHAANFNKDAL